MKEIDGCISDYAPNICIYMYTTNTCWNDNFVNIRMIIQKWYHMTNSIHIVTFTLGILKCSLVSPPGQCKDRPGFL
jgi:hypothetical protein